MLTPTQILTSHIVANSTMNRSRGLNGVNSYTKDLRFDILAHLLETHKVNGSVVWYDVCCGEANALFQAAAELSDQGVHEGVEIIGADLIMSNQSDRSNQSNQSDITLIEGESTQPSTKDTPNQSKPTPKAPLTTHPKSSPG